MIFKGKRDKSMVQHSKKREYYRVKKLSLNLKRNHAFAAPVSKKAVHNVLGRILGIITVLTVSFGVAWAVHLYFAIHSAINNASGSNSATSARLVNRRPISVLILGVDQGIEGRHEQGNSDTIILATANPTKKKVTLTSIPRDTLANIKGDPGDKYFMFRVNSAYEVGGDQASIKTVSSLLNTPINYYLEVNMKALKSLVDAVGGVEVNVPFSFSYDWCDFHKGKQHLNGRHAVAYVRMRKEDPRGDYGRQLRQRQVIQSVAHKAMSINTVANYRNLVTIFNKYVKTNLTFNDMFALALSYRSCMDNVDSGYVQGHDAWIAGSSIQIASTAELQKISNKIRNNLGLPQETINNEETRQNHLNIVNNQVKWSNPDAFTNYQIFNVNSGTPQGSSTNNY